MEHAHLNKKCLGSQVAAFTLSAMALTLGGCGLTNDHITISYTPTVGAAKVPSADTVAVQVQVSDARANKKDVGKKGSEYGILGAIIPQGELADTIRGGIEAELLSRGFQLKEGSVLVMAEISKFYNEFKGFPEEAVAELIMTVQVKDSGARIAYVKTFTGQGTKSGVMLRSGGPAKAALDQALADGISKLFADQSLIEALTQAGKSDR